MNSLRIPKWLYLTLGIISLIIAVIGVVVPLLPTTPLLLLAAACFLRSSERMHYWLTHHRWFGKIIRDYQEHRTVARQTKIFALLVLWASISYSTMVAIDTVWVKWMLLVIAISVTVHIVKLRETPTEDSAVRHEEKVFSQE